MKTRVDNFISGAKDTKAGIELMATDTSTSTDKVTDTSTDTGTLLETKPTELMVRHVCYLERTQSDYVKRMAKKCKVKESEIMRIALKELMKR